MDAVGELAKGTENLEKYNSDLYPISISLSFFRFGRDLLEQASNIIYNELEMFTEMAEDKQLVSPLILTMI